MIDKYIEVAEAYGVETGVDANVGSGGTGQDGPGPVAGQEEPERPTEPIAGRIAHGGGGETGGRITPGGGEAKPAAKKAAAKATPAKKTAAKKTAASRGALGHPEGLRGRCRGRGQPERLVGG